MRFNQYDTHVHSDNSFDAKSSVADICKKAVQKGLAGFAVTDHADMDTADIDGFYGDIAKSVEDVMLARRLFGGEIEIFKGVEIGQPLTYPDRTAKLLGSHEFDFVLASLHTVPGEEDFFFVDFSVRDVPEIMRKYYRGLAEIVEWNDFDSLAHLDYPLRYIEGKYGIAFDPDPYKNQVGEILRLLAENRKAIEINTAALRKPYNTITPTLQVLRKFKSLGGEHVTIGSDAHSAEDVGSGFKEAVELLIAAGFGEYTVYKNRVPRTIDIV